MKSDLAQIRRTWQLLYPAGGVVELRVIRGRGTGVTSGFFDNSEALVRAIQTLNGHAVGAYVTLSRVNPPLFARMANRAHFPGPSGAKDADIPVRDNLLFDFDAVRPSDISSTAVEHSAGIERARMALEWLVEEHGWPMGVVIDSGNGGHLVFRIALPNEPWATDLIKRVLKAVSAKFSDATVVVDESVFNASRITKLPGTWACKGDSTPDRPHRQAAILSAPEALVEVTREQLAAVAAEAPEEPVASAGPTPRDMSFDVERWMNEHFIAFRRGVGYEGGTKYVLDNCPFNVEHQAPDSAVFVLRSGALVFKCLHNSCSSFGWRELREKFEGPRQRQAHHASQTHEDGAAKIKPLDYQAGDEVYRHDDPPSIPIIEGLVYRGFMLFTGRPKSGKSWLTLQTAIAVARGKPLAGWLKAKAGRVLYLALEEPRQRTTARMRKLHRPESDIGALGSIRFVYRTLPMMGGGLEELDATLAKAPADLIIIDTLRAFAKADGRRNDDIVQRDYIVSDALRQVAEKHRTAIIGVDHSRKLIGDVIDAVMGTTGVTAGCDAVAGMVRTPDGSSVLTVRGREHEELVYGMKFNPADADFGWEILAEGDEARMSEERQDILELLKHEGPLQPARIAMLLRKNANTIRRLVSKLVADGFIIKESKGYVLGGRERREQSEHSEQSG